MNSMIGPSWAQRTTTRSSWITIAASWAVARSSSETTLRRNSWTWQTFLWARLKPKRLFASSQPYTTWGRSKLETMALTTCSWLCSFSQCSWVRLVSRFRLETQSSASYQPTVCGCSCRNGQTSSRSSISKTLKSLKRTWTGLIQPW